MVFVKIYSSLIESNGLKIDVIKITAPNTTNKKYISLKFKIIISLFIWKY